MRNVALIFFWILLSYSAGIIGSIFTAPNIPTWYAALNKPSFTPPGGLIGSVWTVLYILMGIAAYLIAIKGIGQPAVKAALGLFLSQLILNAFWSSIFFGWHQPLWALVEIVLLWLLILLTIIKFFSLSPAAGLLLLPYILWVSFASFLNLTLWLMNR
jgi:tryptophan-rich sensory protein